PAGQLLDPDSSDTKGRPMSKQFHSGDGRRLGCGRLSGRAGMAGLGTAVGAFLAAAVTPLATAPPADADIFDVLIDPVIDPIAGVLANAADPLAWDAFFDPS